MQGELQNSAPLHAMSEDLKRKIYIETEYKGMRIKVARCKSVTELIVNDFVYAELKILMESSGYDLYAVVNGVPLVVLARKQGIGGKLSLYADGQLIGEKKRY